MTDHAKVYVLHVGSYSARYVHSVYSTEEAALVAALKLTDFTQEDTTWREDVYVQEFTLDTTVYPNPITFYVLDDWSDEAEKFVATSAEDVPQARHFVIPAGGGYIRDRAAAVGVGHTPEAARKSYDDHIAQCKAEMEGLA